jgi:hypothetical protein
MRRAVTELREAQNPEKRPLLEALTKTPCTAPDVCAFQQLCVSAYQAHVSGFERIERVRRTLDIDAATLEGPSALVTELQRAETALRQARKAVEACSAREGELARAHHL